MVDDSRLKKKGSSPGKSGRGELNVIWSKTLSALGNRGELPDEFYMVKLIDPDDHYFAFATPDEYSRVAAVYRLERMITVPKKSERQKTAK
jgi:hypothetical protein